MTKAATGASYAPEKTYDVKMAGVVDLGAMKLRPKHSYKLTGELLNTLPADKIASAVPSPDGPVAA